MQKFHDILKFIKLSFDFSHPLKVKRIKMPKGYDGDCTLNKNHFLIRIEKNLPEGQAIETFLHEVAHCLAWDQESDAHGKLWGHAYSKVYRKFLEWKEMS
jgi:hypothetical protein